MRTQIAAANWKMNLTLTEATDLLDKLSNADYNTSENSIAVIGVPFPYLSLAKEKLSSKAHTFIAAQNCYTKPSGAYTGETSAPMLKSLEIDYVILGHSERREYFSESNEMLAQKLNIVLENGLKPIFCCGESLDIREAGTQNDFVATQLKESLFHLDSIAIKNVVIAYEPIWAIGTGKTASNEQAQEMHAHLRSVIKDQYGEEIAAGISILYGGSVKAANAGEIFGMPDVDGGLVGGASLVAEDFVTIINSLKQQ